MASKAKGPTPVDSITHGDKRTNIPTADAHAFVDPAKIAQWWGPRKYSVEIDIHEPHSGGRWRYLNIDTDGTTHAFHGVLHEVTAPTRIVRTLQDLDVAPHLVAVSTCYVAGNRRGAAPEQLLSQGQFHVDVDWREEVDAARRARRCSRSSSFPHPTAP